jgi:hypothetical protein
MHLEEDEAQEGNVCARRPKPRRATNELASGQALRAGRTDVALVATSAAAARQRREGNATSTRRCRCVRVKPWRAEPWTWQWGETNPRAGRRSKPSRACETLRTERLEGLGILWHGRRLVRSRRGSANPKEGASSADSPPRALGSDVGGEREAGGDGEGNSVGEQACGSSELPAGGKLQSACRRKRSARRGSETARANGRRTVLGQKRGSLVGNEGRRAGGNPMAHHPSAHRPGVQPTP